MEVANSDLGMNYNNTNSDVNTSSSIDSSATGAAVQSSTNTSAYQTNNTGNTYEVEEIDLSAEPEEEGFFESAGKAVDSGLEKAGAAISNGISAIGNFFAGIGKAIYDTGAKVVSGVKSWVSDRIEDLKGIGKSLSETAANVANNVSSLLGRFGNWVTGTALPAVGNALKKTGASIGNVVTGLIQGVGQFGEALVDTCAIVGTAVGSIVTGIADFGQWVAGKITGNENWHSITKDMWADTMEFVKTEHVNEAFKKFHENSPLGKWLDENAYAPFKSDGAGYKIANGVGYIAGIIALTIATMGIGTAVSGGAAAASGATAAASSNVIHIGSLATIGITKQAVISGTIAATAGFGKNTEHAWNDGAGLLEGMGYGAAKGLWEGGEMFLGASINSLKLANLGRGAIVQQLATTGTHVALDTIDGASASFIDPLMQMIYNPNETNMEQIMQYVNFDENGNRIADKSWDELSFTEKYDALFKFNGGWTSVMTNAGSAAAMSFLSEIPDIRKAVNGTNAIETIAAATTAGAATKEIVGSMGDEAGKETSTEVGKAIVGTASESAETAVKTLDVPKSEIDLYLEKYMMDPDVTPPMGIPQEILDFLKKAETDPDITIPTGMPKEIVDFIQNKSAVTDIAAGTGTSSAVADATTSTAKSIDAGESVEAVAKTFGGEIKYSQEEVEEYLEKFLLDPTTELPPGMKEALDDYVGVSMAAPPGASITAVADEADAAAKEIAGAEAAGATVISTEEAVSAAKEIETDVDSATKAAVSEVSEATDGASEAAAKAIDTGSKPRPSYFDEIESKINTAEGQAQIRKIARRVGLSEAEVKQILDDKIKQFLDESEYGCRVSESTLEKIIFGDGRLKSQFETGTSDGLLNPEVRRDVEEQLFGIPRDLPVEERPIYGMVFPSVDDPNMAEYIRTGPGYWYGSNDGVVIVFDKDKIAHATTYTIGDSLDYSHETSGGLVTNPRFDSGFETIGSGIYTAEDLKNASLQELFQCDDEYLELQIHGSAAHDIRNAAEVVFTKPPQQVIIDKLTEMGIKYRILT